MHAEVGLSFSYTGSSMLKKGSLPKKSATKFNQASDLFHKYLQNSSIEQNSVHACI